jgi:hypothetical protein
VATGSRERYAGAEPEEGDVILECEEGGFAVRATRLAAWSLARFSRGATR